MEQKLQQNTMRDFCRVVFKHKKKALIVFVGFVVLVMALSYLIPPTYEAKSTVLVKLGREYLYKPELGERSGSLVMSGINQEQAIHTEIEILTSRDLIRKVVSAIGVANIYPNAVKSLRGGSVPEDRAVLLFEEDLVVERVPKSNVLQISYSHKDPRIAARAVNLLTDYFSEKHLQVYSNPKSSFLEGQLAEFGQKLSEAEGKFSAFRQVNQVYSPDDQRNILLKQRVDMDGLLKSTQNTIRELEQRINSPIAFLSVQPATLQSDGQRRLQDAKSRLLDLKLKEQELLSKYNEESRLVTNVRSDIETTKSFISQLEEESREQLRVELKAQAARAEGLRRQLAQIDANIKAIDSKDREFKNLQRDVAATERNYRNYLERYEEALISEDMDRRKMANVSVIQAATVPVKPIKPKKDRNFAISLVLGLALGLGVSYYSEHAGQSLSTPAIAEKKLGLNVLASVPMKG